MIAPQPRDPLHRFPLIHTTGAEQFRRSFSSVFDRVGVDLCEQQQSFEVTMNFVGLKNLDLGYSRYGSAVGLHVPADNLVRQQFCISGVGQTAFGSSHFLVDRNETCVAPAGTDARIAFEPGFAQLRLRIQAAALQAKLAALTGSTIARTIEFVAPATFRHPELARLRRLLDVIVSELDRDDANIPPQMLAEFEQLVMVSFLTANPHNFSHLLEREAAKSAPWQVRLLEEYIETNWRSPLSIDDLAVATGGSARSIFKAFKAARGYSPMAFARSVRLRHARALLLEPDEETSVVGVAYHCGFLNPGHFAGYYRRSYGELPSATLMRAKGARLRER